MADPPDPAGQRPRLPTETLLDATRRAAERLSHLSRDPEVRREAGAVAQAVSRLLEALQNAARPPKPPKS